MSSFLTLVNKWWTIGNAKKRFVPNALGNAITAGNGKMNFFNISFVNMITDFIHSHTIRFDSTRIFDSFRDSVYKVFFYRRSQASFTHIKF